MDSSLPQSLANDAAPAHRASRLRTLLTGVALALVCLLLLVPGFFTIPAVDRDESRFAQASRQMLESGDIVVPMVVGINVDLLTPSLGVGAPSTQWWTQLSSAIAGGLSFATVLTLLLTPCLLVLGSRFERRPPPLETFDDDLLDLPEHLLASHTGKVELQRTP